MTNQDWLNYGIQILIPLFGFIFVLGKYKVMFDHQNKTLDKHDQAIDAILKRVEAMNTEFTFMKGWISGKNL